MNPAPFLKWYGVNKRGWMKVLAADAATKVISVAILEGEQIKAEMHQSYSKSQGSALIPVIKRLFEEAGYHIKGIELFCVGLGPGSFTGLRTSVATMRSLSIALGKPIIGISSFDVIACNVIRDTRYGIRDTDICVLFDARQDKVYARFYRQNGDGLRPVTDFLLDGLENILSTIKKPTIITGDAIELYGHKILEISRGKVSFILEKLWYPRADILARMAQDKYERGQRDDPFKLLPLYIYPKECQVKKREKGTFPV
ncbi:MAG: tRNA (adenosine(37)-N6)-threonylcarbamoyltransferase complex dimerization subunit type 1 TsaB [Candidatus Omnitrophota bacterium]|nr:MAG: tRNA (adenosine(37)-N6)-threonylcarbamoyltransferase complex dimerization subunit type 1 TsaB [Candidatus Omnitrophota bacterium]